MKIMVICGSPRAHSRTRGIARKMTEILKESGLETLHFDVGLNQLPLYSGNEADQEHPEVKRLSQLAKEADGFFICTPDYHNGMSGALKNALDFLGGSHFKGKPISIASAAGGGKGGINALNNLRIVMRGVYGMVLPQ